MLVLLLGGALAANAALPATLADANRPMIVFEQLWWDDIGFITGGSYYAENPAGGQYAATLCEAHDITSGYSGTVGVYSDSDWLYYSGDDLAGNVNASAVNVTAYEGEACQGGYISVLTLDDDVMWGLYGVGNYTTAAWAFFDNAVNWAWDNKLS